MALLLGVVAALCWGLHDLCVRRMSQQSDIAASMTVVLSVGCVSLLIASLVSGCLGGTDHQLVEEALAGISFAVATYCLWHAFGCGSVRLVAPIVAAYPVVTLLLAMSSGESIAWIQWLMVLTVIAGVGIVARGESDAASSAIKPAILWSVCAAISFALTFWLGQQAMVGGETWPVLLVTRMIAVLTVVIFMLLSGGLRWPVRADLPVLLVMGILDTVALAAVLFAGRLPGGLYATVTASLFGVVTILLAWAVLKERLLPLQWIGVGITFAAIGVLSAT